jgi:hypothetical protein
MAWNKDTSSDSETSDERYAKLILSNLNSCACSIVSMVTWLFFRV